MKNVLINLALATLLVFVPIKASLVAVGVLTFLDLVLGVCAARKRGESITSSGLKKTVVKLLAYETTVMLGFLVEQYLTGDLMPVVKILGGMIGITELKSVLENLEELTGIPLLQLLIQKLTSFGSQQ
jgi:Bacteriophage holin family